VLNNLLVFWYNSVVNYIALVDVRAALANEPSVVWPAVVNLDEGISYDVVKLLFVLAIIRVIAFFDQVLAIDIVKWSFIH